MTEKRYFAEPLVFDFEAQVLDCQAQADGTSLVILDNTYFYPTGGGQSHDKGLLGGLAVLEVSNSAEGVIHRVQGSVPKGSPIVGQVDAAYRLGNMHAHSGQHVLSAAFLHVLEGETLAVKMSADAPSTVDIALESPSPEQIAQVEAAANRIIMENRPIKSYFVAPENIGQVNLRRELKADKVSGDVRIVDIADWDISACAGTHFPSTGMLGLLKIVKTERYKGGVRISFVVGNLALATFQRYQTALDSLVQRLSTGIDGAVENLEKILAERGELQKTVEKQRETLLSFEKADLLAQAQQVEAIHWVTAQFEARPLEELKLLAKLLTESPQTFVSLASLQGADASLVLATSADTGLHAGNILKAVFAEFGGKGGGSANQAQGVCKDFLTVDRDLSGLLVQVRKHISV